MPLTGNQLCQMSFSRVAARGARTELRQSLRWHFCLLFNWAQRSRQVIRHYPLQALPVVSSCSLHPRLVPLVRPDSRHRRLLLDANRSRDSGTQCQCRENFMLQDRDPGPLPRHAQCCQIFWHVVSLAESETSSLGRQHSLSDALISWTAAARAASPKSEGVRTARPVWLR